MKRIVNFLRNKNNNKKFNDNEERAKRKNYDVYPRCQFINGNLQCTNNSIMKCPFCFDRFCDIHQLSSLNQSKLNKNRSNHTCKIYASKK